MPLILLICQVSSEIGIGHLHRLLALAKTLHKDDIMVPEFLIFGDNIKNTELDCFRTYFFSDQCDAEKTINSIVKENNYSALVFDLYPNHHIDDLDRMLKLLKCSGNKLISIDSLIEHEDILDLIWIPSFNFNINKFYKNSDKFRFGWDTFLIQKRCESKIWSPGSRVLILTGGSDIYNLGEKLPKELDKTLKHNTNVHWVRGPFSNEPILPKSPRLEWFIHNSPDYLDELIVKSDYVMTLFGVSFFEALQYGIPTVVFPGYINGNNDELKALSKEEVAMVADSPLLSVHGIAELMNNNELASNYSLKALQKMTQNGPRNLSDEIYHLTELE